MSKAYIGITAPSTLISINMSASQSVTFIANAYIQIVNDYDCVPIIIPSSLSSEQIKAYLTILDGLILTSGQDLSPSSYGLSSSILYSREVVGIGERFKRPMNISPDLQRDQTEIELYRLAKNKGIPILGVCRGMQLINVAEGGSLYEELPESSVSHYLEPDGWINYHDVKIEPGSLVSSLLNVNSYIVSSIHHQAINKLGEGLHASGLAPDGIIEFIEHRDTDRFIVGVQSHIEKTRKNQFILENIFRGFFTKIKALQI